MSFFNLSELKSLATEELLHTPLVQYLVGIIQKQDAKIESLEIEIRALKGHPKKPAIKPSTVENGNTKKQDEEAQGQESTEKKEKTKKQNRRIELLVLYVTLYFKS